MSEQNGADSRESRPHDASGAVARYVFEIGHLKLTRRSGWALAGIESAESVADHSFRTAVIGFILACQEGADPGRTALLCLFHDTPETRLGDIPSVGKRYLDGSPNQVVADQTECLPGEIKRSIGELVLAYEEGSDQEVRLAKDADKLECLAQAIQYVESGAPQAKSWIDAVSSELSSDSAVKMAEALKQTSASDWWQGFVENYRSSLPR